MEFHIDRSEFTPLEKITGELRRYLYMLPFKYNCDHSKIVEIRRELRVMIVTVLMGEYSHILFGDQPVAKRVFLAPEKWNPALENSMSHSHNGRPCSRKLERGEPTHRCLTCGVDDTCVLCTYCFNPEEHVGHNVFVKVSSRDDGGICDCGDDEAWNRPLHCFSDEGAEEVKPLPKDFTERAQTVFNVLFDYIVDVLSMATMDTQLSTDRIRLEELARKSDLIPMCYCVEKNEKLQKELSAAGGDLWCLSVWDDDRRSVGDLISSLDLATSLDEDFLYLIIEHVQEFGRATVATSVSIDEMINLKKKVRNFPTSIRLMKDIIREEITLEIVKISIDLCHCRMAGYNKTEFLNLIGEALLKNWESGVSPWFPSKESLRTPLGPNSDPNTLAYESTNMDYYNIPTSRHNTMVRKLEFRTDDIDVDGEMEEETLRSAEELFGPDNIMGHGAVKLGNNLRSFMQEIEPVWPLENLRSRVKYMIFFNIRLPKMIRQEINDLYLASLVSNVDLKMQMALIYADVYPLLTDQYCRIDRDPECSVTTALSTQLFTNPSIATRLMESNAFDVYMNLICSLYMRNCHLYPPAFKNRRLSQTFHEIRNLIARNNDKQLVGSNPNRILHTAYFLSLFQGLAPLVRKVDKHVEFENERWIYCFAIMPFIVSLARSVAIGIDRGFKENRPNAKDGIKGIAKSLVLWQNHLYQKFVSDSIGANYNFPIPTPTPIWHWNSGEVYNWITSKTRVWCDPVSLLNPVHWFLSMLIQLSEVDDRNTLLEMLNVTPDCPTLFDANMCTLALISHISVGYWVRNGLSLKIQLQCYRDTTLRDLAYAHDIYMTQVAFSILNPSVVFKNLAYHFGVLDWEFCGLGDEQQTFYTLNEFLQCLIFLLCDRLRFKKLDMTSLTRENLRKEIIHMLGFQKMQYSELVKLVPESMSIDEHFDTVLAETADFYPPTNDTSMGKYALKPEFYSWFDPYFTHFTVAQTEEAVKQVEAKLGSTHLPKLENVTGTWSRLGMFTRSVAFGEFITALLDNIVRNSWLGDTLERVLHLLLMAALDDCQKHRALYQSKSEDLISEERSYFLNSSPYDMSETCFRSVAMMALECQRVPYSPSKFYPSSIINLLITASQKAKFAHIRPRLKLLLDLMREVEPKVPELRNDVVEQKDSIENIRAQRKEKAKKMQEQVMADFMRQQQEFMNKNQEAKMLDEERAADDDDVDMDEGEQLDNEDTSTGYVFPKQCVFCRMPDNDGSVYGVLTYTSKLDMLRNLPLRDAYWVSQAYSEDPSLDVPHEPSKALPDLGLVHYYHEENCSVDHQPNVNWGFSFPKRDIRETTLVQGCGHGLHYKCYMTVLKQHQQQRFSTHLGTIQTDNELLCPLCRALNNCFIPVLWNKNTTDVEEFLEEPNDPVKEMRVSLTLMGKQQPPPISSSVSSPVSSPNDSPIEQPDVSISNAGHTVKEDEQVNLNINTIAENAFKFVSKKYKDILTTHDEVNNQYAQMYNVLFQQMNMIRVNTPSNQSVGLRPLFRAMACCIVHMDVAFRGQTYSTPYGGILPDQLSGHNVQFLRVFAMYLRTITGFVLSHMGSSSGVSSLDQFDDVNLVPNQSFTRVVEMIFLGAELKGISPKTVIRQMLVMEIDRVLIMSREFNISKVDKTIFTAIPDKEVYDAIASLTDMDPTIVYQFIRYHITLTTRRLALIVFSLCGKYEPADYMMMMDRPEYDRLLTYLQMPDLDTILKRIATPSTAENIAHQTNMERNIHRGEEYDLQYTFIDYPGIYRLIKLPNRLDSLFCVAEMTVPAEPALCLLCGHMCAVQDCGLFEQGPCNQHMATCGVAVGIFLLPRRNVLLLLIPNGRGTFMLAPYLDLHGEPDEHMRRGRPHYLQRSRYDAFTRDMWLRNAIPSLVMRRLDQNQDSGGWETL